MQIFIWDQEGAPPDHLDGQLVLWRSYYLPKYPEKVRQHPETNVGISRYEKLPLYLVWAGLVPNEKMITEYSDQFSSLVMQRVIASDWVSGILDLLRNVAERTRLFIVTTTP